MLCLVQMILLPFVAICRIRETHRVSVMFAYALVKDCRIAVVTYQFRELRERTRTFRGFRNIEEELSAQSRHEKSIHIITRILYNNELRKIVICNV